LLKDLFNHSRLNYTKSREGSCKETGIEGYLSYAGLTGKLVIILYSRFAFSASFQSTRKRFYLYFQASRHWGGDQDISPNFKKSTLTNIYTGALVKLKSIWQDKKMSMSSKIKFMKAIVASTALYGCESWTFNAESERRIQAFEFKCLRRMLPNQ